MSHSFKPRRGHTPKTSASRSHKRLLGVLAGAIGIETAVMRLRGYPLGRNVVVRCRKGHLFTTIWLPGGSLKSLRFGWYRYQRCPVGKHFSLVTPVRASELTDAQRHEAREHRDIRIP
jgi:hypothetical protein